MPVEKTKLTRRRFFAVIGGTVVAASSVVAFFRTRGYEVPESTKLASLSGWQFVFLQHAARRIAAPDVDDPKIPTTDSVGVAAFIDSYIAKLHPSKKRDLGRLFAYVEHIAPLRLKLSARFTRLSAADQDRVLAALESSEQDLLRGGFEGLKALVFMGYYRDPRTWKILDYAGPMVARPEGGWQ
ncbi:MAG: gluconate 2-dehydrogenase subunit 3 family protein [Polyangiaceae bacterium]